MNTDVAIGIAAAATFAAVVSTLLSLWWERRAAHGSDAAGYSLVIHQRDGRRVEVTTHGGTPEEAVVALRTLAGVVQKAPPRGAPGAEDSDQLRRPAAAG